MPLVTFPPGVRDTVCPDPRGLTAATHQVGSSAPASGHLPTIPSMLLIDAHHEGKATDLKGFNPGKRKEVVPVPCTVSLRLTPV